MSYSVFIPRVFTNISEHRIIDIFNKHSIGQVDHVDLVQKSNYSNFYMAFVHFKSLYDNPSADCFKRDVENPDKVAKFVYDDPWYWTVCPYERNREQSLHSSSTTPSTLNHMAKEFVYHSPEARWMMTNNGLQWCWPSTKQHNYYNDSHKDIHNPIMIPPQIIYGNLNRKLQRRPKRRLRYVPSPKDISQSYNDNYNNDDSDDDYVSIPEDEKELEPLSARYEEGDRSYDV
jgi:hypothetical protein